MKHDKFLYWMYYMVGGLYSSNEFTNRQKYIWLIFNMTVLFFICILGGLGYILTTKHLHMLVILVLSHSGAISYVTVLLPCTTQYYHNELKRLLDYIERNRNRKSRPDYDKKENSAVVKWRSPKSEALFWTVLFSIVSSLYISIGVVDITFFCVREDQYGTLAHHFFIFPYMNYISSFGVFWLTYVVECVVVVYGTMIGIFEMNFFIMVTMELNNIVVHMCERMQILTQYVLSHIERNQDHVRGKVEIQHFQQNVQEFVKEYQEFTQMYHLIRPYTEFFHGLLLVCLFMVMSSSIFMFLFDDAEYELRLGELLTSLLISLYLFVHCEVGTIFNDMKLALERHVYDLPWYYLSPKERKILNFFLLQIQHPMTFKAFGEFPVTRAIFPKILNMIYSYTSILVAGSNRIR